MYYRNLFIKAEDINGVGTSLKEKLSNVGAPDVSESALKGSGVADVDFDGQVQWTRRVRQNKILKARKDKIFVPESSGHKPGLAETEVMPLPEGSDCQTSTKEV